VGTYLEEPLVSEDKVEGGPAHSEGETPLLHVNTVFKITGTKQTLPCNRDLKNVCKSPQPCIRKLTNPDINVLERPFEGVVDSDLDL
jgi:hypothetical protein